MWVLNHVYLKLKVSAYPTPKINWAEDACMLEGFQDGTDGEKGQKQVTDLLSSLMGYQGAYRHVRGTCDHLQVA